jgi:hypothetical protein
LDRQCMSRDVLLGLTPRNQAHLNLKLALEKRLTSALIVGGLYYPLC